ncbi:MAG: hypothetical protein AAFX90_10400 [Pseudomonadota bacterium]|uniref:hypothetical protein n=1 Tax=Ruegeria sp. SCP10 TaxID=3141377 RepID=UPI003238CE95
MRLFHFLSPLALIVACTPQDVSEPSRSAQFNDYPTRLFETFEMSCTGPGDSFRKLPDSSFECSEYLPPEAAAFLILTYDGSPQNLPKSVMRLNPSKTASGYRVDASLVFRVPQKAGSVVEVPVESEALDQALARLYRALGGSPG